MSNDILKRGFEATADLIERLEAAGVGSRELDHAMKEWLEFDDYWRLRVAADWTTSLDAALALAERVLPGWTWLVRGPDKDGVRPLRCFARVASPEYDSVTWEAGGECTTDHLAGSDAVGDSQTGPLALCIAILRAKETPMSNDHAGAVERVRLWAEYEHTREDEIAVRSMISTFTAGDLRTVLSALSASEARLRVAVEALGRQADNMAFVLDRVDLPESWFVKFDADLTEDRQALATIEGDV